MATPIAALVRRELLVTLRKHWAFAGVALTIGVASTLAWYSWPRGQLLPLDAGDYARQLLGILAFTLYGAVLVFIPGLAATAIAGERSQDTFDQVSLTLLGPGSLVYGKVLNTLGFFGLFVAAVAPVMALVFMLLGVDWLQFLVVLTVVVGTAFCTGSVGIAASARTKHLVQANILTYAFVLLIQAGGAFLALWTVAHLAWRAAGNEMAEALPFFVPYVLLYKAYWGNVEFIQCLGAFLFQVSFGFFALYYAMRRVKRIAAEHEAPAAPRPLRKRRVHGYRGRTGMAPIGDVTNPVCAKDVHVARSLSKWLTRRKLVVILLLLAIVETGAIVQVNEGEGSVFFCLLVQFGLVMLIVPAVASASLTTEFTPGTWDALRLTQLRGDDIVSGKTHALFRRGRRAVAILLIVVAPLMVTLAVLGRGWDTLITAYAYMAVGAILTALLALFGASFSSRPGTGQTIAYGLSALMWFGAPFFNAWVAMFATDSGSFLSMGTSSAWVTRTAVLPSPLLAYVTNFDRFSDNHRGLFTGYWVASLVVQSALCWLAYVLVRGRMRRLMEPDD